MPLVFKIFNKNAKKQNLAKPKPPTTAMSEVNPLVLWQLILDKQSSFCGIKRSTKNKGWKLNVSDLKAGLVQTMKLVLRFAMTMGVLYLSAIVFAYLEDPVSHKACVSSSHEDFDRPSDNETFYNTTSLRLFLQSMENITFNDCDLEYLTKYVKNVHQRPFKIQEKEIPDITRDFDHYNVQKWFYFVIIATTTIGYGDVSPKTATGKMFYCFFSVIGIVLMMSLLKSCGGVLNSINKRFHQLVRYFVCPGSRLVSDEFLSVITMTILFILYLSWGIVHDSMTVSEKHSLLDITYFWIVTLTTVGFGDISHSLEFEIEHAYELTVYRVFGLSMVAGIIEAIQGYIIFREESLKNEDLEKKLDTIQNKVTETLQAAMASAKFQSKPNPEYSIFNAMKQVSAFDMEGKAWAPTLDTGENDLDKNEKNAATSVLDNEETTCECFLDLEETDWSLVLNTEENIGSRETIL